MLVDRNREEVSRVEAYVRAYDLQLALDHIASHDCLKEHSFQRYLQARGVNIRQRGGPVDVVKQ